MAVEVVKGEDILLKITLRDADKNPYDLTGKTVTVKAVILGVLTPFTSPDVEVVNAVLGQVTLRLSDTVTENLAVGDFNFDVYIEQGININIVRITKQVKVIDRLR